MDEDLKWEGSGLLQSKYFGIRWRALRKTRCTGVRMQEGILYILWIIKKSFLGLRRPNPSHRHHEQYHRFLPIYKFSLSSVIGMYHPICCTALESGSRDYSFAIMNIQMHGTGAWQFNCWFYIVTPSCQAPDGWIRDPTLQRTTTPLGSLSPIVTPSHAQNEQNGHSYFRPRIRKPTSTSLLRLAFHSHTIFF